MRAKLVAAIIAAVAASGAWAAGLTPVGSISFSGMGDGGAVAAEGNFAYFTAASSGGSFLIVIDVSNPAAPREVSRLVGVYGELAVRGRYVYAFSAGTLTVVDVANPVAPVVAGTLGVESGGSWVGNLALANDYVYAANFAGLHVIDARNPAAMVEVGTLPIPQASGVAISDPAATMCTNDTYALVTSLDGSLRIVNVTDPAAPWLSATIALGWGEAWGVAASGQYAFVASHTRDDEFGDPSTGKLHVVDVSNPRSPVVVASRLQAKACREVVLAGGYAYLYEEAVGYNGTYDDTSVVDVRTPTQPVEVARMRTSRSADVAVNGSYVYVPQNGYPASVFVYQAYAPATPGGL